MECWGASQLVGDGTVERRLVPTAVTTPANMVVALLSGDNFTLAQGNEASLFCWGQSGSGQCGDGAAFTPGGPVYLSPIATLSDHFRTSLFDAGGSHGCSYVATGTLTTCWGSNDFGELGSGTPGSGVRTSTPQAVEW